MKTLEERVEYIRSSLGISKTMLAGLMDVRYQILENQPELAESKIDRYYNYFSMMQEMGFPAAWLLGHINEPFDEGDEESLSIKYYLDGYGLGENNG